MIFLVIFLSLLFLIILLLANPIRLKIDSQQHIYRMDWKHLIQANLTFEDEEPLLHLKSFFWQKEIKLLEIQQGSDKQKKPQKKKSKNKKPIFNFRKKYKQILKAIQVKQFYVNIDTDDFVWNAYLFPLSYFINTPKRHLQVNFQGDQEIRLELQSRPIRMLYALLR